MKEEFKDWYINTSGQQYMPFKLLWEKIESLLESPARYSEEDLMEIALEKYSSPHGNPNPETYAYIVLYYSFFSVLFLIGECSPKEGKISKCLTQN
jgi:hypothetical protein